MARGVSDAWNKLGKAPLTRRVVAPGETTGREFWKGIAAAHRGSVMLVWLGPQDLSGIDVLGELPDRPSTVFVSSTLLAGKLSSVPDGIRKFTFLTYPTRLPEESEHLATVVRQWLRAQKLPVRDLAVSTKVFFMTRMLGRVLREMRANSYRDYFLDLFDTTEDQAASAAAAPRLTFGPGQRYASKGCYLVTLTNGPNPKVVRQSDWIIY